MGGCASVKVCVVCICGLISKWSMGVFDGTNVRVSIGVVCLRPDSSHNFFSGA